MTTQTTPQKSSIKQRLRTDLGRSVGVTTATQLEIHSDQGSQFESQIFQEMCKLLEINKTHTTAYHPQSDGMIERMNRTVKEILYKYISVNKTDWGKFVDNVVSVRLQRYCA